MRPASGWLAGASTKDYPGYDKMIDQIRKENFDQQVAKGFAWVGTPADVYDAMMTYHRAVGGFEIASLHVNPATTPFDVAIRSVRMFAEHVMPRAAGIA